MQIAVVGSGPAGLTAAYRLQQAGHQVDVLEALDVIGGRTRAVHFGPGHHCDTGAGWLASFYTHTLSLFDELGIRDTMLRPRQVRGAADLLIDGALHPWPLFADTVAASTLLTDHDKATFSEYIARLMETQPDQLEVDLTADDHDAEREFSQLGPRIMAYIMQSAFEGPFFTRLDTLSAAMVRSWLRALQNCRFFQLEAGMDAPWLQLARQLNVQTGKRVERVRLKSGQVEVVLDAASSRAYDGLILAVPAPAAAQIMQDRLDLAPTWLSDVRYAPQLRVYAARQTNEEAAFGVHVLPPTDIFSVEHYTGGYGAWGACPDDWQWGLVCSYGPASQPLLEQTEEAVTQTLWQAGQQVAPSLFPLEQADIIHLIRWPWAVPIMGPGYYRRLAEHQHRPPIVFAGDWMCQACVEGAVRSGESAAAALQGS